MIEDIITDVLKAEGWDTYTNDPADRGGPTKWGITLKAWSEYRGRDCTAADVQAITEAQARDFYEKLYVIGPKFNQLPPMLVPLVVDCGVNHGVRAASKWGVFCRTSCLFSPYAERNGYASASRY